MFGNPACAQPSSKLQPFSPFYSQGDIVFKAVSKNLPVRTNFPHVAAANILSTAILLRDSEGIYTRHDFYIILDEVCIRKMTYRHAAASSRCVGISSSLNLDAFTCVDRNSGATENNIKET